MMTQNFNKDFDYLIERIFVKKQHTIFSRYADGELALMMGKEVGNHTQAYLKDNWNAPSHKTKLGKDLGKSLKNKSPDKFYGISCGCCDPVGKKILLDNLKIAEVDIENITYSNLWINGNYKKFKGVIENITEDVILIANKEGSDKKYPFNISTFIPVENDCVNFWENHRDEFLQELYKISQRPLLYLISAGPMSETIIDFLSILDVNKNGRYIDVGSALDEYTKGSKTRSYMFENQLYYNKNCEF
jgi:hypothetical protein